MINFSEGVELLNFFAGSEKKKTILYDGKRYMVKFPNPARTNDVMTPYVNNTFSEYIGCKIFQSTGIKTQNVILGTYTLDNKRKKVVCACEDFNTPKQRLVEFSNIAISNIDIEIKKTTDISYIEKNIRANKLISTPENVLEKFWDMFIVDAFIGNPDRHNANWGFLENLQMQERSFAPIYDCGSAMRPLLSEDEISNLATDFIGFKDIAYNIYSSLKVGKQRIHYALFLSEMKNENCNKAMMRMMPYIDMQEINNIINETEFLSEQRKVFYKQFLEFRYEKILLPVYKKLLRMEKESYPPSF